MDNITHSLTGLALARLGLNRIAPRATLLLILSANVPDLDIVCLTRGQLAYFEAHRGYTHSLICLPLMAGLCVLITAGIHREKQRWTRTFLLCCLGVGSHLLLDWTNSYGVRLLVPFSSRWFHSDLNPLYDVWVLVALIFGAVWPMFSRLVSAEIGDRPPSGRGSAIAALSFFLIFDVARAALHKHALGQLEARLYEDTPALQVAALPDAFTPFRWRGIVETETTYRALALRTGEPLNLEGAQIFYKPAVTRALSNAKATNAFQYFLYFARFPVWSQEPVNTGRVIGTRLDLTDLRFGVPGGGSFHCVALEDENARVLESIFTFGDGSGLGRGTVQAESDR